ncbi:DUF882 domain-containing protein [Phreatobacter sp.]|uniref:DUF882 domain-containing protein n=1 Tax=Phreatobacter sp. TaxID=1966341 RepID=UPI003F703E7A
MTPSQRSASGTARERALRAGATAALSFGILIAVSSHTQTVVANGDTRTLSMLHKHTGEQILVTFKRNGRYDRDALNKLNWFLRDWRRDEPTRMDPHLFDVVWEVYRSVGAQSQIHVVSAYRSPGTNAMLRRRSRAVAQQSRHITGQALDFYIPGASMVRVREAGMRLQRGGVGFYPGSANQFVHMDTGSVRHWPKVSRDYLARLFPDGRTVHIPADGRPLAGFDSALAMVRARGGSASRTYDSRADEQMSSDDDGDRGGVIRQRSNANVFAGLFGGARRPAPPPPAPVVAAPAAPPAPAVAEAAPGIPARTEAPTASGRPVQIAPAAPRMLIAAAPIPPRAPPAAARMRDAGEEEAEAERLVAAPLPPARPTLPGETVVAMADAAAAPAARGQNRPSVLPEPGQTALPAIITTGDQRGRAGQPADAPPAVALAFASPSRPVTLPQAAAMGPQPRMAPLPLQRPQQDLRSARSPAAAPLMVAPTPDTSRTGVALARQTTERGTSAAVLSAPDLRQQRLIEQPVQMVAMTFSRSASGTVDARRFAGEAVASLATVEFSRAGGSQNRASLSR